MTEYDYWKIFPRMPRKVTLGDITVRDGFQHLEKFISTRAKIFYAEEMIFAGCRNIEVTNLGSTYLMPQFSDAEEVLAHLRSDRFRKRCHKRGVDPDGITITAVTIREPAVDRAIALAGKGIGPDRCLMMVSTEEEHHFANSGLSLPAYWKECESAIRKCRDAGLKMCGTVSTIWGSPIAGATDLADAVEFAKRWLEIGATDIEHADHDGSASAPEVYRYFSMILDEIPDTSVHIAHFHETKRVASASVLAALQAGICHFEGTLGGLGGQPANFLDDCPVPGTGEYYYEDPRYVGLTCLEDMLVQIDEMGIEHGYDVDRVLWLGRQMERTVGQRLRSEAVINGRTLKTGHPRFARPELKSLKAKLGEVPGQKLPADWAAHAVLPEHLRP
ncbi:hydroxymethylglutaryl-CoA lyase [Desulfosarcina ovata subsp. sediminis]|uniref:Hydroxymethylglutaryl-CoA lyase n=1 Tax=Desulfosarcina ovata subsp. sediminis TaxID=885957 RepID=A0A5K7ZW62_9BACT|nr:pyruvate carboxyltransferase [Desulfosarcina ovata]BBO84458.1 hydroxymethylglutaryl-CoA lyase [Desulfosarcina ovata subsp. sediminis]